MLPTAKITNHKKDKNRLVLGTGAEVTKTPVPTTIGLIYNKQNDIRQKAHTQARCDTTYKSPKTHQKSIIFSFLLLRLKKNQYLCGSIYELLWKRKILMSFLKTIVR